MAEKLPGQDLRPIGDADEELWALCARLKCTEKQIWAATTIVGFLPQNVEDYLRETGQID